MNVRRLRLVVLHPLPGVGLAVRPAVDLEVAVGQRTATVEAAEAPDVVLGSGLVLEVLALDATAAAAALAAVETVVVLFAVGLIVQDVELG